MHNLLRPASLVVVLLAASAIQTAGQSAKSEPSPFAAKAKPEYIKVSPAALSAAAVARPSASSVILVFPPNAKSSRAVFSKSNNPSAGSSSGSVTRNSTGGVPHGSGGNIPGLLTLPTFSGAFAAQGGPAAGNVFPYVMIGNDPLLGGKTEIPAHITTVSLNLLNPPAGFSPSVPFSFETLFTNSPNFVGANYSSGNQIQFGDAVQRAEFFNTMGANWHTVLNPSVVNRVTIDIPRFVQVQLPDGSIVTVQSYFVGQAPDGTQYVELLDLLFDFFYFNQAVNDLVAGNYTTDSFNMQAWPNTYLFSIDDKGHFSDCCALGFHEYIYDSSQTPQPRWIFAFASWISPGLFGNGFQDVVALSHETSEAFNDPFGDNPVPLWQFPGQPADSQVCQGNLETGDPVEVLPDATVGIFLKDHNQTFLYHPQTEALLQWFEMGATSNALGGDFSYPNTSALTQSAVPCPQ